MEKSGQIDPSSSFSLSKIEEEKQEKAQWKKIEKRSFLVLIVLTIGSLYFSSLKISISLILGGLFAIANFRLLAMKLSSLMKEEERRKRMVFVFFTIAKYPLLFLILGFLILNTPIHLASFIIGFGSLIFAILGEALLPSDSA